MADDFRLIGPVAVTNLTAAAGVTTTDDGWWPCLDITWRTPVPPTVTRLVAQVRERGTDGKTGPIAETVVTPGDGVAKIVNGVSVGQHLEVRLAAAGAPGLRFKATPWLEVTTPWDALMAALDGLSLGCFKIVCGVGVPTRSDLPVGSLYVEETSGQLWQYEAGAGEAEVSAVNIAGTALHSPGNTVAFSDLTTGHTITLSKPLVADSGGLLDWDAWSAYASNSDNGGLTWLNYGSILGNTGGADTTLHTFPATLFATATPAYAAIDAELPLTFTGRTEYKIVGGPDGGPTADNRGGFSLLVTIRPPAWVLKSDATSFEANGVEVANNPRTVNFAGAGVSASADDDRNLTVEIDALGGDLGATDNALLRADGTAGQTAQGSAVTVDDSGGMVLPATLQLTGKISPTQITANQNDYNPTSLATAIRLRLTSDASRDITGLQGGADGRLLILANVGANNIVLKDESASSTAANRFALDGDLTLIPDTTATLIYDGTSSRWRLVALGKAAAGGGSSDLTGSTGLVAQTGSSTYAARTLTAPAAGITVTNGSGASGNPTLALANDLSAVEGLSGTGFGVRTAADTWTLRSLSAGAGVTIGNADGVSGNPTISVAGGAGGVGMIFVGSATVTGAAATTLTLSGLDLNTDGRYFVIATLKNATTSTPNISLYYNSDTTAANYNRQRISATSTALSGTRGNDGQIGGLDSNAASTGSGNTLFQMWISNDIDARPVAMVNSPRTGNSNIIVQMTSHEWRTASTNVTGITVSADVANTLAIGSKIEVWKFTT